MPGKFTSDLKRLFPQFSQPELLALMRQDSCVWNALQDTTLLENLSSQTDLWLCPAGIFSLKTGLPYTSIKDRTAVLPVDQIEFAVNELDRFIEKPGVNVTLDEAGWLGLAIREELESDKTGRIIPQNTTAWKTILACWYGFVKDGKRYLSEILLGGGGYELVIHILLTNYIDVEDHRRICLDIIQTLSLEEQIQFLKIVGMAGRSDLRKKLAQDLIAVHNFSEPRDNGALINSYPSEVGVEASRLQSWAMLEQYAGHEHEAMNLLNHAASCLRNWMAEQCLQQSEFFLSNKNYTDAQTFALRCQKLATPTTAIQRQAYSVLAKTGWNLLDAGEEHLSPFEKIARAEQLNLAGKNKEAKEYAGQVVAERWNGAGKTPISRLIEPDHGVDALDTLVKLELLDEALLFIDELLIAYPNDPELIVRGRNLYDRCGDYRLAATFADWLTVFRPGELSNRRYLARLLEKMMEWREAEEAWRDICLDAGSNNDDQLHYAQCSLNSGNIENARIVCENLIEIEPDSGPAHLLLGQALVNLGEKESGLQHLGMATLLNPDDASAWQILANTYIRFGEREQAIQTLQSALTTNNSGDLHHLLGNLLLEEGGLTEALNHYQAAFDLCPANLEIAYSYTKILEALGFITEAKSVISIIKSSVPDDPRVLAIEGKIWCSEKEYEKALPAWEGASSIDPEKIEYLLGYAGCLLELNDYQVENRMGRLQESLGKILYDDRENAIGRYYLGRMLSQQGDDEAAFSIFNSVIDYPQLAENDWPVEVRIAMGNSAWKLGLFETAIQAFSTASNLRPRDIKILKNLAEAKFDAGMLDESKTLAYQIQRDFPGSCAAQRWFARMMIKGGEPEKGMNVLLSAVEANPEDWCSVLQLSDTYLDQGNTDEVERLLTRFSACEQHTQDELWLAAAITSKAEKFNVAYGLLNQLTNNKTIESARLNLQMAILEERAGDIHHACQLIEKSIESSSSNRAYLLYYADLLAEAGDFDAAISVLEKAERIGVEKIYVGPDPWEDKEYIDLLIPDGWYQKMSRRSEIHQRQALLAIQKQDTNRYFEYAQTLLAGNNSDITAMYAGMDAAKELLHPELAVNIFEEGKENIDAGFASPEEQYLLAEIYAIYADLMLDAGRKMEAEQAINKGSVAWKDHPRLMAVRACAFARSGNHLEGFKDLEYSASLLYKQSYPFTGLNENWKKRVLASRIEGARPIWLAKAYQEFGKIREASIILQNNFSQNVNRQYFSETYIRFLIHAMIQSDLFELIKVNRRAPHNLISIENHKRFDMAVEVIHPEQDARAHWLSVGNLLFNGLSEIDDAILACDAGTAAYIYRTHNQFDKLLNVANRFSEDPAVLIQYALMPVRGIWMERMEAARHAQELDSNNPVYLAVCAKLEEEAGDLQGAELDLRAAVDMWSDQASWYAWLGKILESTNNLEDATECWEKAVSLYPGDVEYLEGLMNVYYQRGLTSQALDTGLAAIKLDNSRSNIWSHLALSYRMLGNFQDALLCAQKSCELAHDDYRPQLIAGEIALQMGELEQATHYSQSALMLNPENNEAVQLMADIYMKQGQPEIALGFLEQAINKGSKTDTLELARAKLVREVKGVKVALPIYRTIAGKNPKSVKIWSDLAFTEAADHNIEKAIEAANSALKIDPNQPDLMAMMGKLCLEAGHLDRAIDYYSEAIRREPGRTEAYLDLGKAYLLRREVPEALREYNKAIKIAPQDYRPYYAAALAQRENKAYGEAETLLRKASHLAPENIMIRRQLAAVIALNMVHQAQEASI